MANRRAVAWSGSIDARTAPALVASLTELINYPGLSALTVDLGAVTVMDSTGLGALVRVRNAALEHGITLTLHAVPPRVKSLMSRTGLAPMFEIEPG